MSRRYPNRATCEHCGLEVPADAAGVVRNHVNMAVKAGRFDAACAAGSRQAMETEAANHVAASQQRRQDYREQHRQPRESKLPPHLR